MLYRSLRAAAAAGLLLVAATTASADMLPVGKKAPAWTAKTITGKSLSSSQLKGKVVLLNFFSYT